MIAFFQTPVMLALDALFVIYTLWAISLGTPGTKLRIGIGAALFSWLAALYGLLSTESLFPDDISDVAFYAVVLLGVGAVGAILFSFRPLREMIAGLDQRQLMLLQGIRVFFGATFLIQGGMGVLPGTFGLIDGLTHISAGFFGLIAAFSVVASVAGRRRVWFANAFGLGDILIVATSLAFALLQDIGPHHPMMYAVFLPAPFWLWFHVVSIWKLLTEKERATDTGAHAAAASAR